MECALILFRLIFLIADEISSAYAWLVAWVGMEAMILEEEG
jgi:hypothetical protein